MIGAPAYQLFTYAGASRFAVGREHRRGVQPEQGLLVRVRHRPARDGARSARPGRRTRRQRLGRGLCLRAGGPDLRGHERDPARHHRRAAARPSEGPPLMRFLLDDEQRAFAHSLDAMLAAPDPAAAARAWAAGDHAPGLALWSRLAEAGVFALAVPEPYEGVGPLPVELAVAFVELGRHAVPGPVVETVAAAALLTRLSEQGDTSAAKRLLPSLASGEALATLTTGAAVRAGRGRGDGDARGRPPRTRPARRPRRTAPSRVPRSRTAVGRSRAGGRGSRRGRACRGRRRARR